MSNNKTYCLTSVDAKCLDILVDTCLIICFSCDLLGLLQILYFISVDSQISTITMS